MNMGLLAFSSKNLRDSIRRKMLYNSTHQEETTKLIMRQNIFNRMKNANALVDVLIISNVALWIFGLAMLIKYS